METNQGSQGALLPSCISRSYDVSPRTKPGGIFARKLPPDRARGSAYQPFGDLQSGNMEFVVKHDVSLNEKDRLVWQGENFFIEQIDKSAWLGNGLVVQIIRARRE